MFYIIYKCHPFQRLVITVSREYKNQEIKHNVKHSPLFNRIVLTESQWSRELACPGLRGWTGSRWGNRCAHQKNCYDALEHWALFSKGFLSEARCAGRACWRWPRGLVATWAGWLQITVRVRVRLIRLDLDLGSLIFGYRSQASRQDGW